MSLRAEFFRAVGGVFLAIGLAMVALAVVFAAILWLSGNIEDAIVMGLFGPIGAFLAGLPLFVAGAVPFIAAEVMDIRAAVEDAVYRHPK